MRIFAALLIVLAAGPAWAADPLAEARRLYNLGNYDTAARYARDAMKVPAIAEPARLVLGRIYLERYRRTADSVDLVQAREALRAVNTEGLERRERVELTIGLGEALFLDDRFGPAAELFERALDRLMIQGIIPDRAGRLQPRDPLQASAVMLAEWEALKTSWTR